MMDINLLKEIYILFGTLHLYSLWFEANTKVIN